MARRSRAGRGRETETGTFYGDAMSARYDADFEAVFGGRDRGDLAFFQALARATRGPICEVGAGTGRVLLAVAEAVSGRVLSGVEPSDAMRALLAERVTREARGGAVRVLAGSFERIPLRAGSQGLVFGAFRSFQHVLTTEAQLRALAEVRRVLRPGGVLALDLFDPAAHHLRSAAASVDVRYRSTRGTILERRESRVVDRVAQCVEVTYRWLERDAQGVTVSDESATYRVRYTYPIELEHLLARSGFVDIDVRADYAGRRLGPRPRDLVVVCRKPGPPGAPGDQVKRSGSKAARKRSSSG